MTTRLITDIKKAGYYATLYIAATTYAACNTNTTLVSNTSDEQTIRAELHIPCSGEKRFYEYPPPEMPRNTPQ